MGLEVPLLQRCVLATLEGAVVQGLPVKTVKNCKPFVVKNKMMSLLFFFVRKVDLLVACQVRLPVKPPRAFTTREIRLLFELNGEHNRTAL